eukprot:scaffold64185_cov27-Tisochrysis_lutea.AAC.1
MEGHEPPPLSTPPSLWGGTFHPLGINLGMPHASWLATSRRADCLADPLSSPRTRLIRSPYPVVTSSLLQPLPSLSSRHLRTRRRLRLRRRLQ